MTRIPRERYGKIASPRKRVTMARRAARRDAVEPEIVAVLEGFGMSVFLLNEPVDALVGFRGVNHLVEIKSGRTGYGRALNDNQQLFAEAWRGPPVVTLHSREEAQAWAQAVCRGGMR